MANTEQGAIKGAATRIGITVKEYLNKKRQGLRHCWKCRRWLLQECFALDGSRSDGLSKRCFDCSRVACKKDRHGIPSKRKGIPHSEQARARMHDAAMGENNHRWKGGITKKRVRDYDKEMARRAVNHAVEAGRLAQPKSLPCFDCGNMAAEYDHYRGYGRSSWLDVQAVCRACHRERHRIKNANQN